MNPENEKGGPSSRNYWEHFEHGADVGIRGVGETLEQAFVQAARALSAVITDLEYIQAQETITVECEDPDPELLLVDWLNTLIYEMATRRMIFSQFEVQLTNHHLRASVKGELLERTRHQPAVEPKGATFTALKVEQRDDGLWQAQCVVDV